jgi:hypothetical protein
MRAAGLAIAIAAGLAATGAWAASGPHPLMDRLDQVMGHIQDADHDGDLTRTQSDHLKNQFQTVLAVARRYAATGGLDSWERRDLNRMLDDLEGRLRRAQAKDRQTTS